MSRRYIRPLEDFLIQAGSARNAYRTSIPAEAIFTPVLEECHQPSVVQNCTDRHRPED